MSLFDASAIPSTTSPTHEAPLDGIRRKWKPEWITIRRRNNGPTPINKLASAPAPALQTFTSTNPYNSLHNDTGDFTTPWKLDSAASDHYAGKQCGIRDRRSVTNGIQVGVANGDSMHQIESGTIPFNHLPSTSTSVAIFEHMPHGLLGCGRFVKDGCKVILDNPQATVIHKNTGKIILTASFDPTSSTWNARPQQRIPHSGSPQSLLPSPLHGTTCNSVVTQNSPIAYNAYRLKTKRDLISFYGGAAGWPVKPTWIKAINNGSYASWPGLTAALVNKYYEKQIPTIMGHMHARRSGIRSTKQTPVNLLDADNDNIAPPRPHILRSKQRNVGAHLVDATKLTGAISTDFCGRCPHTSSRGMKYIFVLYDYDSNAILAVPTQSRESADMVAAYDECYQQLKSAGITPILQYLDNEVSAMLIESIKAKNLDYQLASPHDHRLNPAERAVQTFKNHFIAILAGCDSRFPKYLWCRLVFQAVRTLNMLRISRINPKLSAHDQVFGVFDYNRTPLAPLGTKIIIHERPDQRPSWGKHGKEGWLIGPAIHHYRHYTVIVSDTGGKRVSDTIEFLPMKFVMPTTTSDDRVIAALEDIAIAINNPVPETSTTNDTLRELHNIFAPKTPPPPLTITAPLQTTLTKLLPLLVPGVKYQSQSKIATATTPIPGTPLRLPGVAATDTSSCIPPTRAFLHKPGINKENIVAQPRTAPRTMFAPFPTGTIINKTANGELYQGKIIHHDARRKYYRILYPDNTTEEMTHNAIDKHLYLERKQLLTADPLQRIGYKHHTSTAPSLQTPSARDKTARHGFALAVDHLHPEWYDRVEFIAEQAYKSAYAVLDKETGKKLEYRQLIKHPLFAEAWLKSGANEFGRLFQGIGRNADGTRRVEGTNTCFWIAKKNIPRNKRATYARIVCEERPEKSEVNRTRITAGGDRLDYDGDTSTETAGLTTAKLLFNSVVSTPGARFMTFDISNMYLNTPLKDYQYMRFHIDTIPDEVIYDYNLDDLIDDDGWVYCEIRMAIYGLKESGRLANEQLQKVLAAADYLPCRFTHGLYRHVSRPICFSLCVDDFGVKYVRKEDALHLEKILNDSYPMKADWTGNFYLGLTLDWNYAPIHANRSVTLSMPGYVADALVRFQHTRSKPTHSPSPHIAPVYGKHQQMAPTIILPTFTPAEVKRLQQICGTFLYYARAVDVTMAHALNDMSSQITTGTHKTTTAVNHFLDYCATYPDTTITYYASDMILRCDSDAAYLVAPKARSRAAGYIFLGNRDTNPQIINAPVLILATILKMVVSSAAEAEIASLFQCARELVPLRTACIELGHPQPPTGTPLRTDNSTADGILNNTMKQKRSKAMDMKFWWLTDRVSQNMFDVSWAPGATNLGDYFSKHQPVKRVRTLRPLYTTQKDSPRSLQGCVKLLALSVPQRAKLARHTDSDPVTANHKLLALASIKNKLPELPFAPSKISSCLRTRSICRLANNRLSSLIFQCHLD